MKKKALYNTYVAVAKDVETALNNKDYKTAIDENAGTHCTNQ